METEQRVLGYTTRAFFPDVTDIKNHEESKEKALWRHFERAKPLAEGALAVLMTDNPGAEEAFSARDLLEAFLDAMAMGEEALDEANIHNQPPFVTLDELEKMIGGTGLAEVTVIVDGEGFTSGKMVRIGRDMSFKAEKGNGKKNGKKSKKAA